MWPFDLTNQSMSITGLTLEQKDKIHLERHPFFAFIVSKQLSGNFTGLLIYFLRSPYF